MGTPTAASYTVPSVDGMVGPAVPQTVVVVPSRATAASPATFLARAMPAPASLIPPNATPTAASYTVPSQAGTAGPDAQWPVEVAGDGATDLSPATWRALAMPAPLSPTITAVALAAALYTVPSPAGTAGPAVPSTVVVVPKLVTAASRATFLAAAMPAPISLKAPNATPTAA